ncbi:TnsA endonuclease N-terminal domain-containing protein [Deinococcus sp. 14RED07]|nr:TnsA endonuclease N-terminal domain-containing protein [Deinococcus sp. 12RED42]MCD0168879.1 TnsA endonuclease N-terminal domain-containing protein [Deinococcus sp. 23YEL01]MCD0174421.1 TnsA endonuclease N-terminal domain-containing protein [Deinococcus sp. 14RED07]
MNTNRRDSMTVQQVRRLQPTRRSVSGIYAFRGETGIEFESTLERDFLVKAEFALDVLDVIAQPVQIPFVHPNGQTYHYTPDFLVYYRLGSRDVSRYPAPLLVEVKPRAEWQQHWREWSAKWKAAMRYARDQGWSFHIHDESRIRDQVLLNIQALERYKRSSVEPEVAAEVMQTVRDMGHVTLDLLLARHFMGLYRDAGKRCILSLLATRQLEFDATLPLNDFSELWMPTDE